MTDLDIEQIKSLIPHRYPFLLIDKLVDIVPNESATGIKNVTFNENFFQGHFDSMVQFRSCATYNHIDT